MFALKKCHHRKCRMLTRQTVIAPHHKSVFARRSYKAFWDDWKKRNQPFIFHTDMYGFCFF